MQNVISRLPCPTGVVGQCAALPVLSRGDEVPDEALDVLISTVVEQAVGQECAADGLYVSLPQRALEASVGQDVTPAAPAMHSREYKFVRAQFLSSCPFEPRYLISSFVSHRGFLLIKKSNWCCLQKVNGAQCQDYLSILLLNCCLTIFKMEAVAPLSCCHSTWPWEDPVPLLFDGSTQALFRHRPAGLLGREGDVRFDFKALHCFSKKKKKKKPSEETKPSDLMDLICRVAQGSRRVWLKRGKNTGQTWCVQPAMISAECTEAWRLINCAR